jgi:hypothetical protein
MEIMAFWGGIYWMPFGPVFARNDIILAHYIPRIPQRSAKKIAFSLLIFFLSFYAAVCKRLKGSTSISICSCFS